MHWFHTGSTCYHCLLSTKILLCVADKYPALLESEYLLELYQNFFLLLTVRSFWIWIFWLVGGILCGVCMLSLCPVGWLLVLQTSTTPLISTVFTHPSIQPSIVLTDYPAWSCIGVALYVSWHWVKDMVTSPSEGHLASLGEKSYFWFIGDSKLGNDVEILHLCIISVRDWLPVKSWVSSLWNGCVA